VFCSVLQCAAVCCGVCCSELTFENATYVEKAGDVVAVCCNILQRGAMSSSVLQCFAVFCSVLQCVAVCCSELQRADF